MTNSLIEISENEFDQQYPLLMNHLKEHASWALDEGRGCLFGTHGQELAFVR